MTLRPQLWFNLMLGAAVLVLCGLLVVGWVKLADLSTANHALATQAQQGLKNQTANRTSNVAVWCGAINTNRDYDRAFVARITRGRAAYTLPDLDCKSLEKATLKSAKG